MEQDIHKQNFEQGAGADVFYPEPERVQCLNFLLHLAPYSDGVLLVTGATGSGKTSLLQQFQSKAVENWRICLFTASASDALAVFLRDLQQGFGFSLHGATDLQAKVAALVEHFAVMHKRGQKPILIIDEAHGLSPEIAEFIDRLLGALVGENKGRMTLILVGEPELIEKSWCTSIKHYGTHSFALNPLSYEETSRLIAHHLEYMGLPADSLTSSQVKSVFKQARGNVGESKLLLASMLTPLGHRMEKDQAHHIEVNATMTENKPNAVKKPIKFSRILFGMLTILMVLALYFEDEINELFEPSQSAQQQPITEAPLKELVEPTRIEVPAFDVSDLTSSEGDVNEGLEVVDTPSGAEEALAEIPESEIAPIAAEETQTTADAVETIALPTVVPEEVPEKEKVVKAERVADVPQMNNEVIEEEPEVPEVVAEVPQDADDSGMIRRERWVLEQNPEHYTLQIMSFSQELGIAKVLAEVQSKDNFFYFKYKKGGKVWYRLAYGLYPDRKSAQADAASGLPKALGKVEPWVRRIGDVQNEITSQ